MEGIATRCRQSNGRPLALNDRDQCLMPAIISNDRQANQDPIAFTFKEGISDAHTTVQFSASLDFIESLIIRPIRLLVLTIQKPTQFSFTFFIFV